MNYIKQTGLASIIALSSLGLVHSNNEFLPSYVPALKPSINVLMRERAEDNHSFMMKNQKAYFWDSESKTLSMYDFPKPNWTVEIKEKTRNNDNVDILCPIESVEEWTKTYIDMRKNNKLLQGEYLIYGNKMTIKNCPLTNWRTTISYDKEKYTNVEFTLSEQMINEFNKAYEDYLKSK
ncbi:MAG: hypothetical protein WC781_01925 [Candidatus Pacearchaeota archaeon]|jgi:hypothetical protein